MEFEKKKNLILLLAPIPIKNLREGKKILRLLIATSIKEGKCSDTWKFVVRHCANEGSQIQGTDFDQSYMPVDHANYFRINIYIMDIHRLTARIFDVSNGFQNINITIYKRVCVIPLPNYLYWFEKSDPNVPLN